MPTMDDAEAAAADFYGRMEKPVPPRGDVLGGAQEAPERPSGSPPRSSDPDALDAAEAAARRFYGHGEPQDRAGAAAGNFPAPAPEAAQEAPGGPEEPS